MKKVLIEAPILTQSGYGEHSRFVYRSLRERDDVDIHILPLDWGSTSWCTEITAETKEIEELIKKTAVHTANNENPQFDVHIHVGIPNEFERKAPYAVHVTAGIETTKISKEWLAKTFEMDKIIVPSEHAKWAFENTSHKAEKEGKTIEAKCQTPVEVVPYPVRDYSKDNDFNLDLKHDFNFLSVAMWCERKNMDNMINWFVEEFKDEEVGLVLKTAFSRGSLIDRNMMHRKLKAVLEKHGDRKCKVYLLHGNLSNEEMKSLYTHKKIKAMVSAAHGEGFGLPLFEAACNGMPIIAPAWSGYLDFLRASVLEGKKGKKTKRMRDFFAKVEYSIQPVQKSAVWNNIIIPESMWCFPREPSFKNQLRNVYNNYSTYKTMAQKNKRRVLQEFAKETVMEKLSLALVAPTVMPEAEVVFVSDYFQHQLTGGAEMSLQALINASPTSKVIGINSSSLGKKQIEFYKDKRWVFGNIANLKEGVMSLMEENKIKYTFVEFDYKFCKYRNPALYEMMEAEECKYSETILAQKLQNFINGAESVFFMSDNQRRIYENSLENVDFKKSHVLSSLFDAEFFQRVESLNKKYEGKKNGKWIVLGSESWVKGAAESEAWCKEHNKSYEVVNGLDPLDFLEKLAESEGVCFKPVGLDTCPRFIIEAKLLGCKLELNENVQHRDEGWFNTSAEEMKEYLQSRSSFFWEKAFPKWNNISL